MVHDPDVSKSSREKSRIEFGMIFFRRAPLFLALFVAALRVVGSSELQAETLPDRRPALIGSGPGSLVNLIDVQVLFQKGQRDAWVMFECGVAGDGYARGSDFFTASPNADLLKNEIRKRLRQTRFIPAVYNHKRTSAWFAGTVAGYVWYDLTHYYLHHAAPTTAAGKWLRKYHLVHHFQTPDRRYGITTPIWDFVFRTYPRDRYQGLPDDEARIEAGA